MYVVQVALYSYNPLYFYKYRFFKLYTLILFVPTNAVQEYFFFKLNCYPHLQSIFFKLTNVCNNELL